MRKKRDFALTILPNPEPVQFNQATFNQLIELNQIAQQIKREERKRRHV